MTPPLYSQRILNEQKAFLIVDTVADDGATPDIIRRSVNAKPKQRTVVTKLGGINVVLGILVSTGILLEDDGFYVVAN